MSRIVVVIGNPLRESLVHDLAAAYAEAAERGAEVRVIDLAGVTFALVPESLREIRTDDGSLSHLESELKGMIEAVQWAEHLVFVYPVWWGTYPAVLKGFIDRVFISGFAFRYRSGGSGWDKLLAGRTARIIHTMDSPRWWNRVKYRDATVNSLRWATLWYCGIATIGVTRFPTVRMSTPERRASWFDRIRADARRDLARLDKVRVEPKDPAESARPIRPARQ